MRAVHAILAILPGLAVGLTQAAIDPPDLHLERWPNASTSFSLPVAIRHAGDGSGRVFVIEKCSGIRVVKNGSVLPTPFLSLSPSCANEQGILGLAFDPDYANNGTFYITYSAPSGEPRLGSSQDQVLARYTVSSDPDVANPGGTVILRVPDIAGNHNGGDLHFDPQGYLNWSMGDGGVQGDPHGFAQCTGRKKADNNPATCYSTAGSGPNYYLMGKILRIDVHHSTPAPVPANFCGRPDGSAAPYAIPPENPFADVVQFPDDCAEVFNWGFRNPFRFSFDRATGDLLIGDVGQNRYEEIDFQPAGSVGQNFQWHDCEGFHTYPGGATPCAGPPDSVPPKIATSHSGPDYTCAIIGGFVYRGPIVPLRGQYLFGDNCSSDIYVVADPDPNLATWSREILNGAPSVSAYSFGEDEEGNLYVSEGDGKIYRFASAETTLDWIVTPLAGAGGALDPATPQTVPDGATTTFEVLADAGYVIDQVSGCGGSLSATTYTTGPITADCTVEASFSAISHVVTPSATGGGSITPDTPQTVADGATVSFALTPAPWHVLDAVGGDCGGGLLGLNFTTLPVYADCTVEAVFIVDPDLIFHDGFDAD